MIQICNNLPSNTILVWNNLSAAFEERCGLQRQIETFFKKLLLRLREMVIVGNFVEECTCHFVSSSMKCMSFQHASHAVHGHVLFSDNSGAYKDCFVRQTLFTLSVMVLWENHFCWYWPHHILTAVLWIRHEWLTVVKMDLNAAIFTFSNVWKMFNSWQVSHAAQLQGPKGYSYDDSKSRLVTVQKGEYKWDDRPVTNKKFIEKCF